MKTKFKYNTRFFAESLSFSAFILLVIFIGWFMFLKPTNKNQPFINKNFKKVDNQIVVGNSYLFSFDWKEKVKVLRIKNGYIEWQYKNGLKNSCEIKYFKHLLKYNKN
jgi:hypothetical protein